MTKLIPVGISSCLMGDEVRYNGGHKQSKLCLNKLSNVFEFRKYCPEVAIGLPIPRETIHMIGTDAAPRVVGTRTAELDVTEQLSEYGDTVAEESSDLRGYIFMQKSPSCGLFSAKIWGEKQPIPGLYAGMYARRMRELLPLLPMEEEGRLHDAVLRENFVARVYVYDDWKCSVEVERSANALVKFHSRYKFMVMAHGQDAYKTLGQLVAKAGNDGLDARLNEYIAKLMGFLAKPATRKGHVNTLYHILGYLKETVDSAARQEIVKVIESYRRAAVNLSVPAAMLGHYVKLYGEDYVKSQVYLQPYSEELGLRNDI